MKLHGCRYRNQIDASLCIPNSYYYDTRVRYCNVSIITRSVRKLYVLSLRNSVNFIFYMKLSSRITYSDIYN